MSDNSATYPRPTMSKLQHAIDETSLWLFFAMLGGAGASLLAVGILLRSNQQLTRRMVVGTVLHSVAWGAAVFLMMVDQTHLGLPFMLGVSIFSGMGLASFIDVVALLIKKHLGVTVTINPPSKEP